MRDRRAASERNGVKLYEWAATTRAAWNTALDALETVRPSMLEPINDASQARPFPDARLASLPPEAGGDIQRESAAACRQCEEPLSPDGARQPKYAEDTWEWTIGREFYDHIADRGAFLLEASARDVGVPYLDRCHLRRSRVIRRRCLCQRALAVSERKSDADAIAESGGVVPLLLEAAVWLEAR